MNEQSGGQSEGIPLSQDYEPALEDRSRHRHFPSMVTPWRISDDPCQCVPRYLREVRYFRAEVHTK